MNAPKHVAIILDGNGRWARSKGLPRNYGHIQGAKNVEKMCEITYNLGIQYFTVYAFSTENWLRPKDEVEAIMNLLRNYLKNCIKRAQKNNMCVKVLGDLSKLDEDLKSQIFELEKATKDNKGLHFQVAINYGSRDEILRAVKKIIEDTETKKIRKDGLNEELFSSYLDTKGIPDPDLLIRTSGEQRISNYLLWQLAYTELYFTNVAWPDFGEEELKEAIEVYNNRDRRYGAVKED